jgi:hypothetical protein
MISEVIVPGLWPEIWFSTQPQHFCIVGSVGKASGEKRLTCCFFFGGGVMAVVFDTVLVVESLTQKPSILNFSTYVVKTFSLYTLKFQTWFQWVTSIRPAMRKGVFHVEPLSSVLFSSPVKDTSTSSCYIDRSTSQCSCLSVIRRVAWTLLCAGEGYRQRPQECGDALCYDCQSHQQTLASPEQLRFFGEPVQSIDNSKVLSDSANCTRWTNMKYDFDFRLPPRCWWNVWSFGWLHGVVR